MAEKKYRMNLRIVDVNKQLRDATKLNEFMGIDISGPDYRFEIDTPTGGEVTFNRHAEASYIMAYAEREGWDVGLQL